MTTQFAPIWDDAAVAFTTIKANATDTASAAATTLLDLQVNNVSKFVVDKFGELIITPTARTSGSGSLIDLIAPADTTRAASTEATDVNFNLARTVQFEAGNITDQRAVRIQAPTYSFASASTITNAATLSISGPPVAGTNATITNRWALNIDNARVGLWSPFDTNTDVLVIGPSAAEDFASLRLRTRAIVFNSSGNSGYITNSGQNADHGNLYFGYGTVGTNAVAGFTNRGWAFLGQNMPVWFGATSGAGPSGTGTAIYAPAANTLEQRNTTNAQTFRVYNTFTDASNYERLALQFGAFSSVRHAQIAAESSGTGTANINLVLTPKGTGAFILGPPPDGTAVGGNTRGNNAVDLQTLRDGANQVASGQASFITGYANRATAPRSFASGTSNLASADNAHAVGVGCSATAEGSFSASRYNTASGIGSTAVCNSNLASATSSFASGDSTQAKAFASQSGGHRSIASRYCQRAHAAGWFTANGDCQSSEMILRGITTTNAAVRLRPDGSSQRLTIASGQVCQYLLIITGVRQGGSQVATYMRKVCIKNIGGTTTLVGNVETIGTDLAVGTSLSITADDVNDDLAVEATGVLNQNWRWNCIVYGGEISHE